MNTSTKPLLLVGTGNRGKFREMVTILGAIQFEVVSLFDVRRVPEPDETGASYMENATLKARYYAETSGVLTVADDSGLEVSALNLAPGLISARYAGVDASDHDRRSLLLSQLSASSNPDRTARFVCAVALASPDKEILFSAEGVCAGYIAKGPRGESGFGYDPLFIPDGYSQTFAELPDVTKNQISHRGRALAQMREFLIARQSLTWTPHFHISKRLCCL